MVLRHEDEALEDTTRFSSGADTAFEKACIARLSNSLSLGRERDEKGHAGGEASCAAIANCNAHARYLTPGAIIRTPDHTDQTSWGEY